MMEAFKGIPTQKVHVSLTGVEGKTILDEDVEFPAGWDYNDILVVSSRYLCNSAKRKELSLFDMIERVSRRIAEWAAEVYGWNEEQRDTFAEKLAWFQVHRYFAFNSPVYFNVGLDGEELAHACFILDVDDSLESIYDWIQREMRIFRRGAGSGVNLSKLRGSVEKVSGGGLASGPVSFLAISDVSAATIKSGGRLRRAAKLARLDCWHIDIEKFITAKQHQERKARILVEEGVITDPIGEVPLQATNLSVGVTDEFMRAILEDKEWELRGAKDDIKKVVRAKELFEKITTAAWDVGCPGLQFHDTINKYNPALRQSPDGKLENVIMGSNPCFSADTYVTTDRGLFKIRDLVGKTVTIFDGESWVEIDNFRITGENQDLLRVYLADGSYLDVTPYHTMVLEDGRRVEAKDLRVGDRLAYRDAIVIDGDIEPKAPYLKGFLLAEGHVTTYPSGTKGIGLCVYPPKKSCIPKLLDEFEVLGIDASLTFQKMKTQEGRWLVTGITELSEELIPWDSDYRERGLPDEVYRWSLKAKCEFISGLFDGDGTDVDSSNGFGYQLSSVSKKLLVDVQRLLKTIGVYSKLSLVKPGCWKESKGKTCYTQPCYCLTIPQKYSIRLAKLVKFQRLKSFADRNAKYDIELKYNVVTGIEKLPGKHTVYCCTVPTTNSLLVENMLITGNCGEYYAQPNTACNLASLNLLKFYDKGKFNHKLFNEAVNTLVRAMTAISYKAGYPDEIIKKNTQKFHNIGIGYTNLAALLLTLGLPYDSDEAAYHVGLITAYLQGCAIKASQKIADELGGPYPEFTPDRHKEVMTVFKEDALTLTSNEHYQDRLHIRNLTHSLWKKLDPGKPAHNAQFTLLAPTGTISFLMGAADSTGIEPFYSLVTQKRLMDGKVLTLVPKAMVAKLTEIYGESKATEIAEYIVKNGVFPSDIDPSVKRLFRCAISEDPECVVSLDGRIKVAAAAQKFLSGAISITFNLPNSATPQDVAKVYMKAWEAGLKGVTIYRDGSKAIQVLYSKNKRITPKPAKRYPLPQERSGKVKKFRINSVKGYIITGEYPDGSLGEVFVKIAKEGSTLAGLFDTVALLISIALQHGVPLDLIVDRLRGSRFEPAGLTGEEEISTATSPIDYLARYLELSYLKREEKKETFLQEGTGMFCHKCGSEMVRKGGCYVCKTCGEASGSCE